VKQFAALIQQLGTTTAINDKLDALVTYFSTAPEKDLLWLVALFSGRRPKRLVKSSLLQEWCAEQTQLPRWLFDECYHTVGDLAETIALLLPESTAPSQITDHSLHELMDDFLQLQHKNEVQKKTFVLDCWASHDKQERFVFNKLITGGFRIGVSQSTMVNALARFTGIEASVVAHRISGNWHPNETSVKELLLESNRQDVSKPYPFYLSYALDTEIHSLNEVAKWQAEWKWDGIRGQIIQRSGELFVWSRGEELLTSKFPEYEDFKLVLPQGTVLDGEIISMHPHSTELKPLPFAALQTRISRKNITRKQLQEAPAAFIAYDLLEWEGVDIRSKPLSYRREQLEKLVETLEHPVLRLSPLIEVNNWTELIEIRQHSREHSAEGVMLKRKDSVYQAGRKRGDWWKWKIDPLVIDCVLVYAQKGHGRRSNLYTDYTFAVRNGGELVTFTKAYSGLTDQEFAEVDAFVKQNSLEKFGPVRTVKPELVFEIAFEGIAASKRHKSGVALRFPRMNRWRKDKPVSEINTLQDLQALLQQYGS
jgi:DNA ligase 1